MLRQDQFEGLVAFVTVAEARGFSAAAARLGVSPSAVSQAIRSLEHRVGFALFNRTTRSVGLTEVGQRYYDRVRACVGEVANATDELGDRASEPSGLLRLNVPRAGYMIVLQPILRRFLDAYRQVSVEIVIDNALVDIVGKGCDAGIRFGDLLEKDMVAIRIGPELSAHIIASADYLERRGVPKHPRELLDHDCIAFRHVTTGQVEKWAFAKNEEAFAFAVNARLTINDSEALVQSALDGLGIAYMINGYLERFLESGRLVRILADWSPRLEGLHLYYPDRKRVPAKLRALIDFLRLQEQVTQDASILLAE